MLHIMDMYIHICIRKRVGVWRRGVAGLFICMYIAQTFRNTDVCICMCMYVAQRQEDNMYVYAITRILYTVIELSPAILLICITLFPN